ncbi:predicted protein [Chaetoceros tenuissimus]|uniref:Uncharacterized protein n=1 Tax=Chaetoceros tenuissimus TaxID=426638 RepID=A0AAD3D748_9STRA|nr:predicted protein [Chaetoceros tenuissimus]
MPKKEDPYRGDNFKPGILPCDIVDLGSQYKTKTKFAYLTTACKFSESLFQKDKKYELLRQTPSGAVSKSGESRVFKQIEVEEMKRHTWFNCIWKDVTRMLKSINPTLQISKFLVLKASAGCKQQRFHHDHYPDKPGKRYTVIFSIMNNTTFDVKMQAPSNAEVSIKITPASMIVFQDSCEHAGSAFEKDNFRFYFLGTPKDEKELGGDVIHFTNKNKDDDKIHLPCLYCRNHITHAKKTSKDPRRGLIEHYRKCVSKLMIVDGMKKREATKTAKERKEKSLNSVKTCMENKAKAEQEAEAETVQKKRKVD